MSMQAGNPKKPVPPKCAGCGKSLMTGPKTVINAMWHCAECTYRHDYPEAEVNGVVRPKALPLQEETLFPLPAKKPDYA